MDKIRVKLGKNATSFWAGGTNKVLPNQTVEVDKNEAVNRALLHGTLVEVREEVTTATREESKDEKKK
jgi:hypothetical protein